MVKKHSPGGCKCCTHCDLFYDQFATDSISGYDHKTGDWTVGSGVLSTESRDAELSEHITYAGTAYLASVKLRGSEAAGNAYLIFGYKDASNYYRLEIVLSATADYCGSVTLFKVISGSATQIFSYPILWLSTNAWHTITACVRDSQMTGSYADTVEIIVEVKTAHGTTRIFRENPVTFTDGFGIGVGVTDNTGTVDFDDLRLRMHYDDDPTCPKCPMDCQIVLYEDDAPDEFSDNSLDCEFTLTGTVASASHIVMMTGASSMINKIPNPDDDNTGVLVAHVAASTAGQKIRLYAACASGTVGAWGELDFTAGDTKIRLNVGGADAELSCTLALGVSYRAQLCVTPYTVRFHVGTICRLAAVIDDSLVRGNFSGITNTGGDATVTYYDYQRHLSPITGEPCNPCETACEECLDASPPPDMYVVIAGITKCYNDQCPTCAPNVWQNGAHYLVFDPGWIQVGECCAWAQSLCSILNEYYPEGDPRRIVFYGNMNFWLCLYWDPKTNKHVIELKFTYYCSFWTNPWSSSYEIYYYRYYAESDTKYDCDNLNGLELAFDYCYLNNDPYYSVTPPDPLIPTSVKVYTA